MNFGRLTLLAIFAFAWPSVVVCQESQAETSPTAIIVDDNFQFLDVTHIASRAYAGDKVPFSAVRKHIHQWLPIAALSPLPNNARIWAKISVTHKGEYATMLTLLISNLEADNVSGYVVDEQDSILRIYSEEDRHQNGHRVVFHLNPGESVDVFISVDGTGPSYLPLSLWQSAYLETETQRYEHQQTLFLGALLGLLAYFFFSYFIQRNATRFWFSVACFFCLLFIMQIQGYQLQALKNVSNGTVLVFSLYCLSLMTGARVTHYLFPRINGTMRVINYLLPSAILVFVLLSTPYTFRLVAFCLGSLWFFYQITLCIKYRDRRHAIPAWLYGVSMASFALLFVLYFFHFVAEAPPSTHYSMLALLLLSLSLMLAGIAIETSERGVHLREYTHQEKRIANLRQFYELFRNSAEGLYTSTLDGSLLSVNPAMCHVFGYPDEEAMLTNDIKTSSFYAHPEDRLLLLQDLLKHKVILGREIRGKRRDGSEFWFSVSCQIHKEGNSEYLYGSIFDITERKQSSLSLEYLATHDSLTGVLNRREFERKLQLALNNEEQIDHISLLYLDLDRFKLVNDSCGHQAGDELIKDIASLIHETLGSQGEVARLGGDEFAVLCNAVDEEAAYLCANKLLQAVQDYRYFNENKIFTIGVSIGLLHTTDLSMSTQQLLSMADAACYIAKERGRNQIHQYSPNDDSVKRYESELDWLHKVNRALEHDQFVLYCQPYQVLNQASEGLHFEILVRIKSETGEVYLPNQFLPTAERYNLGDKIDRWVIEHTFKWLSENKDVLERTERCNINLSGQSLANRDLKLAVLNAFELYNIPYSKICFEITETMAVVKLEETIEFIKTFRQLGSYFALDDFGSGFSSYGYLKNLPVNSVKIDGSFIRELLKDPVNQAMVSSIHDIASAMKMETVAEYVEDEATLVQLGKIGVDFAQGYAISKPFELENLSKSNPK